LRILIFFEKKRRSSPEKKNELKKTMRGWSRWTRTRGLR